MVEGVLHDGLSVDAGEDGEAESAPQCGLQGQLPVPHQKRVAFGAFSRRVSLDLVVILLFVCSEDKVRA